MYRGFIAGLQSFRLKNIIRGENGMRRKIAGILVFILLAGTLAGCGGGQKTTPTADNTSIGGSDQKTTPTPVNKNIDDGSEKMTITLMAPSSAGGGWTEASPPVIQKLDEKLNIDLQIQWVP